MRADASRRVSETEESGPSRMSYLQSDEVTPRMIERTVMAKNIGTLYIQSQNATLWCSCKCFSVLKCLFPLFALEQKPEEK